MERLDVREAVNIARVTPSALLRRHKGPRSGPNILTVHPRPEVVRSARIAVSARPRTADGEGGATAAVKLSTGCQLSTVNWVSTVKYQL
jgi:hypothetical protein